MQVMCSKSLASWYFIAVATQVERVTRESSFYPPDKVKSFLIEAKLPDARPLINVCDRFDMVEDLTQYLYSNNMLRYIEGYVQKVNPAKTPQVVGALLDAEAADDFVMNLIISVSFSLLRRFTVIKASLVYSLI